MDPDVTPPSWREASGLSSTDPSANDPEVTRTIEYRDRNDGSKANTRRGAPSVVLPARNDPAGRSTTPRRSTALTPPNDLMSPRRVSALGPLGALAELGAGCSLLTTLAANGSASVDGTAAVAFAGYVTTVCAFGARSPMTMPEGHGLARDGLASGALRSTCMSSATGAIACAVIVAAELSTKKAIPENSPTASTTPAREA